MSINTRYTFDKPSIDRIARTVRWVEDFQLDEGDNTVTTGQNPAFETPLENYAADDDDTTITVVTGIELTDQGLVFKTRDVSSPYIEVTGTTDNVISTTQCEE